MKFRFDGYNYLVRLEKGEQLVATLVQFIKANKVPSCWISGLGGAEQAEVGFYNLEKQEYEWRLVREPLEIASLQGNISWVASEPSLHIHGIFCKRDGKVVGGHVKEVVINGTGEIFLHRWYGQNLNKTVDPAIGLKLLDL